MPLKSGAHVHFVGIGGSGLSAIAVLMLEEGFKVSGCDLESSKLLEKLGKKDVKVSIGHDKEHITGEDKPDALVVSAAIPDDNPEVEAANKSGIPVYDRAGILGELMESRRGVAIAGTHGKTTTASMAAYVLMQAGFDPSYVVGGVLLNTGTNAQAGKGKPFVIEADEYERMFMGLKPEIAIVTGIEHDHPDKFATLHDVVSTFNEFVNLLPDDGLLIACYDDPQARLLAERRRKADKPVQTYGLSYGADWRAIEVITNPEGGSDFIVKKGLLLKGMVRIMPTGKHNVQNALAVLALAEHLGTQFEIVAATLSEFKGVERRFEFKGRVAGVSVIDDYAHHPTAIRTTLEAARVRFGSRAIWVVFQPHTFSRTKAFKDDFVTAFKDANHVVVTDIYPSRETDDLGISSTDLVQAMQHRDATHIAQLKDIATHLATKVEHGDVIITMSAGDATDIQDDILKALEARFGDGEGIALAASHHRIATLKKEFLDELAQQERAGQVDIGESVTWRNFLEEATLSPNMLERLLTRLRSGAVTGNEEATPDP